MKIKSRGFWVSGGGTGGHVSAGIALVKTWMNHSPNSSVAFVGSYGGLEERMVPPEKIPLKCLYLGSINRVSTLRKISTLFKLPAAFMFSIYWNLRYRPRAVVGVGGYASGPFVLTAVWLKPVIGCQTGILEQNSVMGLTNRLLSKKVDFVFTAFPLTEYENSNDRFYFTGNPVRMSFTRVKRVNFNPFRLFIFGGSQGAVGMNSLIIREIPMLREIHSNLEIIHQSGRADYERVKAAYQSSGLNSDVRVFIDDMNSEYAAASLVICRAGSSSISELGAVGRAAILIPLPSASDNHQVKNAQSIKNTGGALVLDQIRSKPGDLSRLIRTVIDNPQRLREMEDQMASNYNPNAAARIIEVMSEPNT